MRAVRTANRAKIQKVLRYGADINKAGYSGITPLAEALDVGHLEIAQMLMSAGADVNETGYSGRTPLLVSAERGHIAIVQVLIDAGANLNKAGRHGMTPLIEAARCGHSEMIQALIDAGADFDKVNDFGSTPLFVAACYGKLEAIQILIDSGANLNKTASDGLTALDAAVFGGHLEIVQALINAGVDFSSYSRVNTERLLEKLVTHEFGNRAWTLIIELVEARTGVRREDIAAARETATPTPASRPTTTTGSAGATRNAAARETATPTPASRPTTTTGSAGTTRNAAPISSWQLAELLQNEGTEAARTLIADKTLVGIVTVSGLRYDSIVRVGKLMMSQNPDLLVVYATESLVDQLGADAFSGFIFPGAGDNYPGHKAMFTLADMPESSRMDTERLYQKVYSLAKQYEIPTFGICAGAQHLVLNRGGALMRKKNDRSNITLQPFTPIHYMSLNDEEQQKTLDQCQTPEITMNVFRAHTYAAEPNHLGEDIMLASIDGETPMAFFDGFRALATQFHPEARYAEVSSYGDTASQIRQTRLLDSFIELCKQHRSFIEQAESAGQTRKDAIAQRDALYQKILERLKECAQLQ